MKISVHKYGGSSLATTEQIKSVAKHIKSRLEKIDRLVVVVSAMGKFTDELITMAKGINSSPPRREMDMLLSVGERVSSSLLCMALYDLNISAISLTGSQCGILTNHNHGNAQIIDIKSERLMSSLKTHKVIVIAGFQGVCPETKDITTLGRGGSDLTAIALAINLKVKSCKIYTDVDGVMTTDPKIDKEAKLISSLDWETMTKMAVSGAKVMHPRACALAHKYNLPFEIRSSFNFERQGTKVGYEKNLNKYKKNEKFNDSLISTQISDQT